MTLARTAEKRLQQLQPGPAAGGAPPRTLPAAARGFAGWPHLGRDEHRRGRRAAWDPDRARRAAAAQQTVAKAWQQYTGRHRGRVVGLALGDFTSDPETYVRVILGLSMDQSLLTTMKYMYRYIRDYMPCSPNYGSYDVRYRIWTHLPTYPVKRDG